MRQTIVERRTAPRYPLVLTAVVIEPKSRAKMSARTSDISRTGCYLDTLNPMGIGMPIHLRLQHGDEVFETKARVVYESRNMGMGIHFIDTPPEQLAILDRWLAEQNEF
jgi:hypothetical protein